MELEHHILLIKGMQPKVAEDYTVDLICNALKTNNNNVVKELRKGISKGFTDQCLQIVKQRLETFL